MAEPTGVWLTYIGQKTQDDKAYSKRLLTDFEFAKHELSKAGVFLTKEQHDAVSQIYQQSRSALMAADPSLAAADPGGEGGGWFNWHC